MRRSLLLFVVGGYGLAVILAEYVSRNFALSAGCFVLGMLFAWGRRTRWVGIFMVAFAVGFMRWHGWMSMSAHDLGRFNGQVIQFTGTVMEQSRATTFVMRNINVGGVDQQGGLELVLPTTNHDLIGTTMTMNCRLQAVPPAWSIRARLHNIRSSCPAPLITSQQTATLTPRLWLAKSRDWMESRIHRDFLQPQSSFLMGILLGDIRTMPPATAESFRRTGTSHLVALSGFNVAILIGVMNAVLIALIGRRWAWLPGLILVSAFVVMTGASASVTRAAIMSGLVMIVIVAGRPMLPWRILSYTFMFMTWHNPLILVHDLGFQLSFLATAGLLYLSKPLELWFSWIPTWLSIRASLATTMAAILATEPLLVWTFGRVTPIAVVINIIVIPLMPIAMAAGVAAILWPAAQPLADVLLRFILLVISWGAATPAAVVDPSPFVSALIAAVCLFVVFKLVIYVPKNITPR